MQITSMDDGALVLLNKHRCATTKQTIDPKELSRTVLNSIINIIRGDKAMPATGVSRQIAELLIRGLQLPVMTVKPTASGDVYFSFKNLPTDIGGLRPQDTVNRLVTAELAALRMHDDNYSHRRWGLVVPMPSSSAGYFFYINPESEFDKIRTACRRSKSVADTLRSLIQRETIHVTYQSPK